MSSRIDLSSVSFSYGDNRVISNLSFSVSYKASLLVVLGPNGVGKSTLLGLIAGHLTPDAGTINVCGQRVLRPSERRPIVLQEHNLYPWKTAIENVTFGLKCIGRKKRERLEIGRRLLAMMNIENIAHSYPASLSGGMRQRIAIARAIAIEPDCLLLDEPFQALDPEMRMVIKKEFVDLVRNCSMNTIIVSHDLSDVIDIANAVMIMRKNGNIIFKELEGVPFPRTETWIAQNGAKFKQWLEGLISEEKPNNTIPNFEY